MTKAKLDETPNTPEAAAPDSAVDPAASDRRIEAEAVLNNHMLVAGGSGLIPIPVVDVVTFLGTNVNLVRRLCQVYDVPFKGNRVRSAVAALASALGAGSVAAFVGISLGKLIPGSGAVAGAIALPVATAGFTYTVGKLFIGHFEAGGTLLDFTVKSKLAHVDKLYSEGKSKAASILGRQPASGTTEPAAAKS